MLERAAIFVRVTHTGVDENGREARGSVTLYDVEDKSISKTARFVPVPYLESVDIPLTSRALLSYTSGAIRQMMLQKRLNAQVFVELRDLNHLGGPLGQGATFVAGIPNVERVGGILRMVIPDNTVGSPDAVGFTVGESIDVSNLTGVFAALNGSYVIQTVTSGQGLSGASTGHFLVEVASAGADIPATIEAGVLTLPDGRVTVLLSSGDVGDGSFGNLAGIPLDGVSAGAGGGGAPPSSSNTTAQEVTQAGHGFTVGQAVYFDGALWQLAVANNAATLATHLVYQVTNANEFLAVQAGVVEGLAGLTPGSYYFVSGSTPGLLVDTDPSTANPLFFSNPILLATSATEGWALPWRAAGPAASGSSIFTQFSTSNNVPVNAQVLSVPNDSVAYVKSTLIGRETAPNTDSAAFTVQAKITTVGAVPTVSGAVVDFSSADAGASWSVSYIVSGGSVVVQVLGDPLNSVEWKLNTQVFAL